VARAIRRPAEPAISLRSDRPFPGALARVLSYTTGALTSFNSAAAVDMDNMEVVVD